MLGNTWLKKLFDPKSYGLAIVVAILLHVVVIALFAIEWPQEKRQVAEPTPKNIQAKVIQTESKYAKQQKLEAAKRRKDENWKKYLAEKKAAKQKIAQEKAAKDKARRDEDAKNKAKALADKKRADKKKADDQKKHDIKQKQEALVEQKAFEQAQEQALLEALAVEQQQRSIEKAMAAEQQLLKNTAITNDVAAQIRAKISQVWRYPPSARPDMEVVVRIQLVPTGEVINVSIISGSGNEALDRSVLAAVNRAQTVAGTERNSII